MTESAKSGAPHERSSADPVPMIQNGPWPALCRVADDDVARELAAFVVERARRIPGGGACEALARELKGTRLEIRETTDSGGRVVFDLVWPALSRNDPEHMGWRAVVLEWGWRRGHVSKRPESLGPVIVTRRRPRPRAKEVFKMVMKPGGFGRR